MIQDKVHVYRAQIDFDLLDAGAVVHHPNYLVLCERARCQAMSDAGYPVKELWNDGFALALTETRSRYRRPLGLADPILILTKLESSSGVRLLVRQSIFVVQGDGIHPSDGFHSEWFELGNAAYSLDVTLTCVRLFPIRSARFPERLIEVLKVSTERKQGCEDNRLGTQTMGSPLPTEIP